MSSELANSSDVDTSPSEPDFERNPSEPFNGLVVQVSSNFETEAPGSSSSYRCNLFITRGNFVRCDRFSWCISLGEFLKHCFVSEVLD